MIDMSMKLDPCPRCGGPAIINSHIWWVDGDESITVKCLKCGLSLDYSSSKCWPRTSVKWDYDTGEYVLLDEVWSARKDGWND